MMLGLPDPGWIHSKEKDMLQPEEYDVVVLGSGAAGKLLAWTLASQGRRTAVVERQYVGGSCPNIACLPSKNVIHGAKVADYFRRGAEFGIANGDWKVDMAAVRDRKRRMVYPERLPPLRIKPTKRRRPQRVDGAWSCPQPTFFLASSTSRGATRTATAKSGSSS
jgi:hypothetical protein